MRWFFHRHFLQFFSLVLSLTCFFYSVFNLLSLWTQLQKRERSCRAYVQVFLVFLIHVSSCLTEWLWSGSCLWLLPPLWQQVLRLRLQDNNVIFYLTPPAPFLSDLTKIWDKISEPESGKKHKRDLTRFIWPSEWAGQYRDVQVKNAKLLLTEVSPDQLDFAYSMSFMLLPPAFP